ncbi:MAG TPA: MFS transporter [Steroidobacter sp.]|uniref:MFS transporter n=1 Tax=Steroidobacter sp. TaxID=1978227 RepID=UPI002ED7F1F1
MKLNATEEALPLPAGLATGATSDAAPAVQRLPLAHKAGYASGQLAELIIGSMLNMFALFYVTAVCGLPGALAGVALGAGLVIDAILDPMIGSVSDGWKSRYGRRVPFMVAGIVPLVVTFNLMFALPSTWSVTSLFIWLTLLSITLRVSLSIFYLPYQALGAELSDDYAERSSIAAWRWGVGIFGTVAVIVLGYGVFLSGPNGVARREGYLPLTLTLTVLIVIAAAIAIRTGLVTRRLQHDTAPAATQALHRRLLGEIGEMFRNRTFLVIFGSSLLLNVAQGIHQALALHAGLFFWGLGSEQMQMLAFAAVLGLVVAAPLVGLLVARIEKRTLLVVSLVGLAVSQASPTTLKLLGLLPLTGDALIGFLVGMAFIVGLMFALSIIAFISIIPDAADEHEQLFHARREGLFFAGWAFASKAATGAGLLVSGVVLQLIDFPTDAAQRGAAAMTISERTSELLGFAGGPGAGMLALVGTVFALFYRLDRQAHARIKSELAARQSPRAPESHA